MMVKGRSISRADLLAMLLSLAAAVAAFQIAGRVFDRIAHLEDEFAYVWQAQAVSHGKLTLPSPPSPKHFLVPFVVDHNGQRFGKYPLGWPVLLGIGLRLGVGDWINPLLAALGIWLTYRLGKRVWSETVGLLAAFLTLTSPFFLINSGSLLSHPFGLVLSAVFALAWLDAFGDPQDGVRGALPLVTAALALGLLALTRPLTAVGVAVPFTIHGLSLIAAGSWRVKRRLLAFGLVVIAFGALHFGWQFAVTGDPFLNPYTLWWPYDKVGFGQWIGRYGHTLRLARINTQFSLWVGWRDLFGWGSYSWIFLPFGLWAVRRDWRGLLLSGVAPSLVGIYLLYWVGAWLYGPRYYFEGLFSVTLLSAVGIAFLAGWLLGQGSGEGKSSRWGRARALGVTALLALLISANLIFYTPLRLRSMEGLYGIEREKLAPFKKAELQGLTPALVIVHPNHWTEYGGLLSLQDPFLETPFIFVISRGRRADEELALLFPDRSLYHYYLDQPYTFFTSARE